MKSKSARGVTLVEAIVVISIAGILAAGLALFIRRPVEGYVDAVRRAELTDIADTALRRMGRDIRTALPNSIRVTTNAGITYLEYLQTSGGGRYRVQVDGGGLGDILDFTAADTSFDVIGPAPAFAAGQWIVVYNLGPGFGTADAYNVPPTNRTAFNGVAGSNITIASFLFPFPSPGNRFHVLQYPVTYECNPAAGTLRRYWNYAIVQAQPTPPAGGSNAVLATNITGCTFNYNAVTQRVGAVSLTLTVSQSGETVQLFEEFHVSNVP